MRTRKKRRVTGGRRTRHDLCVVLHINDNDNLGSLSLSLSLSLARSSAHPAVALAIDAMLDLGSFLFCFVFFSARMHDVHLTYEVFTTSSKLYVSYVPKLTSFTSNY